MSKYKIPQIKLSYVSEIEFNSRKANSSYECAGLFRATFEDGDIDYRECFKVMYLNRMMKPLGIHTISLGGSASTIVDAKMIFTGALLVNAQTIILCHNHPSGNLRPSVQDDDLTRKLVEAGKVLDLRVVDHIILSRTGFYSYNDEGRI